jgi:hypothetical protein
VTDGAERGGDALRIPVDDFRYLREEAFQEGQQIVTFRHVSHS